MNYQLALEAFENLESREGILDCLGHQARILLQIGELTKTEKLAQRVVNESITVFGENHPRIFLGKDILAEIFIKQGNYGEASNLLRSSIQAKAKKDIYGMEHLATTDSYTLLARVSFHEKNFVVAEKLLLQVLENMLQALGADHPDTLQALHGLSRIFDQLGKQDQMQEMAHRIEKSYRKILGEQHERLGIKHPSTHNTLEQLTESLERQNRHQEAEQYWKECVEILVDLKGHDSRDTLNLKARLADNLRFQQKYEEESQVAEDLLERLKKCHSKKTEWIQRVEAIYNICLGRLLPGL